MAYGNSINRNSSTLGNKSTTNLDLLSEEQYTETGGTFPISLKKKQYSNRAINDIIDRSFSETETDDRTRDVKKFFQLHDKVFFDIPKEGEESHTTLMLKSRDFIRDYIDPKDQEIFALTEEITDLNEEIIRLQTQMLSTASIAELPDFEALASSMDDLEDSIDLPQIVDTNNDGIDDSLQEFSNFGTPRRLILTPGNQELAKRLRKKDHFYYKDKYYGQQIYKYKKKVSGKKNRLVIYEGSKGKTGKRYLKDMKDGKSYKIGKSKWKSKNRDKIFKP